MKYLFLLVFLFSCGKDDSEDFPENVCSLNFKFDSSSSEGEFTYYKYSAPLDKDIDSRLENKDKCPNFLRESNGPITLTTSLKVNEMSAGEISTIDFSSDQKRIIDFNKKDDFSENPLIFSKEELSYTVVLDEDTKPLPSFENKWQEWELPWSYVPASALITIKMPRTHNPSALPSIVNIVIKNKG